jgi:hypothetical protein
MRAMMKRKRIILMRRNFKTSIDMSLNSFFVTPAEAGVHLSFILG